MKLLKTIIITVMLASPFTAFALGGDNPVPGIDIIIKDETVAAKNVRFNKADLNAINKLKGLEKPSLIVKIAAQKLSKANPKLKIKGGWHNVLKKGILKNWCVKCNGGTAAIKARLDGEDRLTENVSIYIKIPKNTKPAIMKMKAKAATKAMVKKK